MEIYAEQHQIIKSSDGVPLFVLVPWDEYLEAFEGRPDDEVFLPLEVSRAVNLGGKSMVRAWRDHLGLTQEEVAERMKISRAAYAQMEAKGTRPRTTSLKKIASALGVEWEQLKE